LAIPESVQFGRCEEVANAVFPVYRHLVKLSADGKLFHIDDTRERILSCYREDKDRSEKERHSSLGKAFQYLRRSRGRARPMGATRATTTDQEKTSESGPSDEA
jgi:hypothetical protein